MSRWCDVAMGDDERRKAEFGERVPRKKRDDVSIFYLLQVLTDFLVKKSIDR